MFKKIELLLEAIDTDIEQELGHYGLGLSSGKLVRLDDRKHPSKQSYKIIGGVWSADARESTSYRLLRILDKRGKIKLKTSGESERMGDEKMYVVKFEIMDDIVSRSSMIKYIAECVELPL